MISRGFPETLRACRIIFKGKPMTWLQLMPSHTIFHSLSDREIQAIFFFASPEAKAWWCKLFLQSYLNASFDIFTYSSFDQLHSSMAGLYCSVSSALLCFSFTCVPALHNFPIGKGQSYISDGCKTNSGSLSPKTLVPGQRQSRSKEIKQFLLLEVFVPHLA